MKAFFVEAERKRKQKKEPMFSDDFKEFLVDFVQIMAAIIVVLISVNIPHY